MILSSDINLDELKAKFSAINPVECLSDVPISEIFKTSSDFKIKLLNTVASLYNRERSGDKIIKLTFYWNGHPFVTIDGAQTWYIDVEEYLRMNTRFVLVEKKQKLS